MRGCNSGLPRGLGWISKEKVSDLTLRGTGFFPDAQGALWREDLASAFGPQFPHQLSKQVGPEEL